MIYLDGVPLLDAGGLSAFNRFTRDCQERHIRLIVADLQFQPLRVLARARVVPVGDRLIFTSTLADALDLIADRTLEEPLVAAPAPA